MKKNRKSTIHNYSKYETEWQGNRIGGDQVEYYGIHKESGRIKIDLKRMKKIKDSGVPNDILDYASQIPRHTTYFLPKKRNRYDYVVNQFRDKLKELQSNWNEYKNAFLNIKSPNVCGETTRIGYIVDGVLDCEEATEKGIIAKAKRESVYQRLWISECAQFIHQMAIELDALMIRKCVYLGFPEKEITRGKLHTYLAGTVHGRMTVEKLNGYNTYMKFFQIWNLLKHNSEDLFEKVQKNYPEMLLVNEYKNGELSQYYLKIGNEYIESMLRDLVPFYESLCKEFFDEDIYESNWNYDEYFIKTINDTIESLVNPLGI